MLKQGIRTTNSCRPTPRAHAPAPSRRPLPRPRRPRQPAVPGRAFPTHPCLEAPWSPPGPCTAVCPCRTSRARATDRRSVGGAPPYKHRSRPGTTAASPVALPSPRSRAAPINTPHSPLLRPALPRHRAICAAAVELRPSLLPTVEQPPMPLP
jgi:hypothetical protein